MHPFDGEKVHWTFSSFHLTTLKGRDNEGPISPHHSIVLRKQITITLLNPPKRLPLPLQGGGWEEDGVIRGVYTIPTLRARRDAKKHYTRSAEKDPPDLFLGPPHPLKRRKNVIVAFFSASTAQVQALCSFYIAGDYPSIRFDHHNRMASCSP